MVSSVITKKERYIEINVMRLSTFIVLKWMDEKNSYLNHVHFNFDCCNIFKTFSIHKPSILTLQIKKHFCFLYKLNEVWFIFSEWESPNNNISKKKNCLKLLEHCMNFLIFENDRLLV